MMNRAALIMALLPFPLLACGPGVASQPLGSSEHWTSTDPDDPVELYLTRGPDGQVTGTFQLGTRATPLAPATDPEACYPPDAVSTSSGVPDGGASTPAQQQCAPQSQPLQGWQYQIKNGKVAYDQFEEKEKLTFTFDVFEYYASWCALQTYRGTTTCSDCSGVLHDGSTCTLLTGEVVSCAQTIICCSWSAWDATNVCACTADGCGYGTGGPLMELLINGGIAQSSANSGHQMTLRRVP